jgi:hypothetical protein
MEFAATMALAMCCNTLARQVWWDDDNVKRLRDIEVESAQPKKFLAESFLDAQALKVALGRKHQLRRQA